MKIMLIAGFLWFSISSNAQIKTVTPGQTAPGFTLKNVDNKEVSFKDYPSAKGFIVVFTCNTCPVSQAYEQRVINLNKKYAPLGYPVIAINPNDPKVSPGDNFNQMQKRAAKKNYSFPYLYDEGQVVTNLYGARHTPHVFLVKKTNASYIVEYTGAIDNDPENTNPGKINYVENAIEAIQKNQKPSVTTTKAIGCIVRRKNT